MTTQVKTITGIHCPSCGLDDAQAVYDDMRIARGAWMIAHPHCGYNQNASTIITQILDKFLGGDYKWNEEPRVPAITLSSDSSVQAAKALEEIKNSLGELIISVKITLRAIPNSPACPICGNLKFKSGYLLKCGDHYSVSQKDYIRGYLKYHGYNVGGDGETLYISRLVRPTGWGKFVGAADRHIAIAQITYRVDLDYTHFLVISRPEEFNQAEYETLITLLQTNLGEIYKVIVKVE